MIVFDLSCQEHGHRFEAWFRSSDDFARQQSDGLLICPHCGSGQIEKAVMAPAVARKGNQAPVTDARAAREPEEGADSRGDRSATVATMAPEAKKALALMMSMQAAILEKSRWVGDRFADEARAIHYGEQDAEPIHGEASLKEAEELAEEGIDIAALPFPVAPPDAVN